MCSVRLYTLCHNKVADLPQICSATQPTVSSHVCPHTPDISKDTDRCDYAHTHMHACMHTWTDRRISMTVVQGTHTAMKSGMLAAQATFSALTATNTPTASSPARQAPVDISSYQKAMEDSYVWDELRDSRNIRPG